MPDELAVPTPDDTGQVAEPAGDQPQTDPQTPDTGQVADNQVDGTTDDGRGQREEFFQTKYQKMVESAKNLQTQLDQYQRMYGDISKQQTETPQQPQYQEDEFDGYDIYSPEGQKAFLDNINKSVTQSMAKTLAEQQAQQRAQAQYEAEFNNGAAWVQKWAADNQVPGEVLQKAYTEISDAFPNARPAAIFNQMVKNIILEAAMDSQSKVMAQKVAEATAKAKDLSGVQQPSPGTAPPVKPSQQKTPEQIAADKFKPAGKKEFDKLWEF